MAARDEANEKSEREREGGGGREKDSCAEQVQAWSRRLQAGRQVVQIPRKVVCVLCLPRVARGSLERRPLGPDSNAQESRRERASENKRARERERQSEREGEIDGAERSERRRERKRGGAGTRTRRHVAVTRARTRARSCICTRLRGYSRARALFLPSSASRIFLLSFLLTYVCKPDPSRSVTRASRVADPRGHARAYVAEDLLAGILVLHAIQNRSSRCSRTSDALAVARAVDQ